jgi:hypothetical protein
MKAIDQTAHEYAPLSPVDTEQLFGKLKAHRPNLFKKVRIGVRAVPGLKNHKGNHTAHDTRREN